MIFSIGAAVLISMQSASALDSESVTKDIESYQDCLDLHALLYERAKESAGDTVDAVFAACRNERATIVINMTNLNQQSDPSYSSERAENFVRRIVDDPKRGEILVSIFESRTGLR